jgi:hypothetical protein
MTHKKCTLDPVMRQTDGWGFLVKGEDKKPLVTFAYDTTELARDARELMTKVLDGASVTPLAQ